MASASSQTEAPSASEGSSEPTASECCTIPSIPGQDGRADELWDTQRSAGAQIPVTITSISFAAFLELNSTTDANPHLVRPEEMQSAAPPLAQDVSAHTPGGSCCVMFRTDRQQLPSAPLEVPSTLRPSVHALRALRRLKRRLPSRDHSVSFTVLFGSLCDSVHAHCNQAPSPHRGPDEDLTMPFMDWPTAEGGDGPFLPPELHEKLFQVCIQKGEMLEVASVDSGSVRLAIYADEVDTCFQVTVPLAAMKVRVRVQDPTSSMEHVD